MGKEDPIGDRLTLKEIEIIYLLSEDHDRNQIAKEIGLTLNAVKTYMNRIHDKLGVNTAAGAVGWAHWHGLLEGRRNGNFDKRNS